MKKSKFLFFGIFFLIFLLFLSLRLDSIFNRSVAYTYDQGRDFLAGARIILDKNPVFIGPTTGIGGVFHGAWWYYFTAISFLLLGSDPISFYNALLFIHSICFIGIVLFTRKLYGSLLALIVGTIIATGKYFVSAHTFAGNNILAIPSFIAFCISLWYLLNTTGSRLHFWLLIFGLSIGFVAEFELSFGIFLIPSLVVLALVSHHFRKLLVHRYRFILFFGGLVLPFIPRILFEFKNGFLQTKVLLNFFVKPKLYEPSPYTKVFQDRILLFSEYVNQAFTQQYITWIVCLAVVVVILLAVHKRIKGVKNDSRLNSHYTYLFHLGSILFLLFFLSLVYRDPFWMNYYEGIQHGFLFLGVGFVYILKSYEQKVYVALCVIILLVLLTSVVPKIVGVVSGKQKTEPVGLAIQESVVDYIVNTQISRRKTTFCARVFTPPVIPHTYDYLWLKHYVQKVIETPRYDFVNGRCWYIIEPEWKGYELRQKKWKEQHIPKSANPIETTRKIFSDIEVVEYAENK